MSDPKETLERLKAWAQIEHWTADGPGRLMIAAGRADELSSDLRTLIAERKGLEREVARQKRALQEALDFTVKFQSRAHTAEAKLSALQEACRPFADDMEWIDSTTAPIPPDNVTVDNDDYSRPITYGDIRRLRALLPTVPVEGS